MLVIVDGEGERGVRGSRFGCRVGEVCFGRFVGEVCVDRHPADRQIQLYERQPERDLASEPFYIGS